MSWNANVCETCRTTEAKTDRTTGAILQELKDDN